MNHKVDMKKICMTCCLITLVFFMSMLILRFFARQVLVKYLGSDNIFIEILFCDNEGVCDESAERQTEYNINWGEDYPFSDNVLEKNIEESIVERYIGAVDSIKTKIDNNFSRFLFGYSSIVGWARKCEALCGWNFSAYNEYNGAQEIENGYWAGYQEKLETEENAKAVIKLERYCKRNDINFFYTQLPCKICKYSDKNISGAVDFSNQNADDLLDTLVKAGVAVYDLRETLHEEGLNHHELFFRTDHHWLPSTGLWASKKLLQYCKEHFGYQIDMSLVEMDNFKTVEYPEWFLGSYGKKVTLERTKPDDFFLLYPKYLTDYRYIVPSRGIDQKGDFSITYDMTQVVKKDYYNKSPYSAYNYGDQALIKIENMLNKGNRRLLIIKDSFGDCVSSFLALGIRRVDVIDLRYFEGSLETYIDMSKPDTVILMYNADEVANTIDLDSHTSLFDFR